ncbi:MAG TPA: hypothetical protein PLM14_06280 [Candidatus Hydrogenedentes bacterium]|nr:hypothetical protein [Candidatus Hydrogenedentota bacterium]HQE82589.1 hypothetical protein [Candidatus Hydrogenedentota bacterium]HQH53514.1 hypothetical protein [Candidatus Hydrogenedentota bacterium]HQM48986.1 hypothetical protein [Candidatus Hydrogenedentota bacterium]
MRNAAPSVLPSQVPVMFEVVKSVGTSIMVNHIPGGGNVLYLDGHVEFRLYPGPFPLSPVFLQTLCGLNR